MVSDANARGKANADEWTTKAIEACENDPEFMATGLCPVCVCRAPCLCDEDRTKAEMVRYFEKYKDHHPMTAGNWGSTVDLFWHHLYEIAITRHEQVFNNKSERTTQRYFDSAEAHLQKTTLAKPTPLPPTVPRLPDPSEWTGRQPRKPGWLLEALRPFWPWR